MKVLELHILQSFPTTCLNRDDVGAPKSALFGGVPRGRVSSQCWKSVIRKMARQKATTYFAGNRSRYILEPLQEALKHAGCKEEKIEEYANLIAIFLTKKITNTKEENAALKALKDKERVSTLCFFSPQEYQEIANAFVKALNSNEEKTTKNPATEAIKKYRKNAKDTADIALFGRMVASDHSLMVEGASMFSHALSTHRVDNEIDFFSAVDDLKPEDTEGAGHIGTLEYNSACYYRYIALNLDLLKENLPALEENEIKSIIETFIRSSLLAVPSARKNSMMGFNPPEYVLATIKEGQPFSLINAFEEPIRSKKGYLEGSIKALEEKFTSIKETYNIDTQVETRLPEMNLNEICEVITKNV